MGLISESDMRDFLGKITQGLRQVYYRAGDLLEEERELPLSQNFLNSMIKKYVTDNVNQLLELRAELHDGWLRLHATVEYKGIKAWLATNLLLVQFQMDREVQRLVFDQQTPTEVLDLIVDKPWKKPAVFLAIWFIRTFRRQDPLPVILEKLNVVSVKHELIYLDINRYLLKSDKALNALRKVEINHAVLREEQFVLKANLNLDGLFSSSRSDLEDAIPTATMDP